MNIVAYSLLKQAATEGNKKAIDSVVDYACQLTTQGKEDLITSLFQTLPTESVVESTGIEALVCSDIAQRQQLGIAKYGTTVADNPLSLLEWLNHAYQECLDQAVYLRRAIEELKSSQTPSHD